MKKTFVICLAMQIINLNASCPWSVQKRNLKNIIEIKRKPLECLSIGEILETASANGDVGFIEYLFKKGLDKKSITSYMASECMHEARKPYMVHFLIKHANGAQVLQKESRSLLETALWRYINVATRAPWSFAPTFDLPNRLKLIGYYLRLGIDPNGTFSQQKLDEHERYFNDRYDAERLNSTIKNYRYQETLDHMIKEHRKKQKLERTKIENIKKKSERKIAEQKQKEYEAAQKYPYLQDE